MVYTPATGGGATEEETAAVQHRSSQCSSILRQNRARGGPTPLQATQTPSAGARTHPQTPGGSYLSFWLKKKGRKNAHVGRLATLSLLCRLQ